MTFYILLRQLVVPAQDHENTLPARAAQRLACTEQEILSCQVVRKSLDARKRRGKAVCVYHLRLQLPGHLRRQLCQTKHLDLVFESKADSPCTLKLTDPAPTPGQHRPVVVGAGPAGLFAALRLARSGWRPLLIERGDALEHRQGVVAHFWRNGTLDPESNVLFGLGGAGLFSDGKLNTRHKDREGMRTILANMVEAGAPEEIIFTAEPHVGSDRLGQVVANIAREIEQWGGEVRYRTRLDQLTYHDGRLQEVVIATASGTETLATHACILATGHSARDVYFLLDRLGIQLEAKPFAIGVRVEIPQSGIDASQRGSKFKPGPGDAASFRLSRVPEGGAAACYTFCMCPGGMVIPCASEPGRLAVNGMSYHARAGEWGNAAFLTPVTPADFSLIDHSLSSSALAGMELQRILEEKAFQAGGGDYSIPAVRLEDFIARRTGSLPDARGVTRAVPADFYEILPENIAQTVAQAIPAMLRRLRCVRLEDAMLYAIETRTSSPVRISRDQSGQSPTCLGLYPVGEGSGYAGGIMTSALDGWNSAAKLMRIATLA